MSKRQHSDGRSPSDEHFGVTRLGGWWQDEVGAAQPEKRRYARVAYTARLRLLPGDDTVRECDAENISLGGLLLRHVGAQRVLPVGQLVELTLTTPDGHALKLDGEIVRYEGEDLFGVRFMNVTSALREALLAIVGAAAGATDDSDTAYAFAKKRDR